MSNKELNIFLATKSKTDLNQMATFCKDNFKVNIYNHRQISFTKSFTKFSTIKNVVNKEDQLEVEVSIRNYYLNNLVEKEVVKILS